MPSGGHPTLPLPRGVGGRAGLERGEGGVVRGGRVRAGAGAVGDAVALRRGAPAPRPALRAALPPPGTAAAAHAGADAGDLSPRLRAT